MSGRTSRLASPTVATYLAAQPPARRAVLERVRAAIRKAVPKAEECISYQIPAYRLPGGIVLFFAGWKAHYSLYPASALVVETFGDELAGRDLSKGTIRFPLDERVPVGLIGRIAKLRAKEVQARARRRLAVVLLALVVTSASTLLAQYPKQAPSFEPGDSEGLVVSPNPRIRHAWKRKAFWKTSAEPGRGTFRLIPPQTAAERAQMTATLDQLTAILKATPNGSNGEGFWMMDSRTLDYFDPFVLPEKTPLAKYPLTFDTGLFPFYHSDVETNGTWQLSVKGETESAYFFFNRLPELLDGSPLLTEARPGDRPPEPFYLRPRVTATWQGLPVYEGQALVVAREGRDPWAPVPLGRALKAAMGAFEKDRKTAEDRLAGYKKTLEQVMAPEWEAQKREAFEKQNGELRTSRPSNYAARLRSLENEITVLRQEAQANANPQRDAKGQWYWSAVEAHDAAVRQVAALSPDEANGPACFVALPSGQTGNGRYAMTGSIVPESSAPGCRQIVRTNWDYFDLSLPRTTPQILFVRDFGRCVKVAGDQLVSRPVDRWDVPPQGCVQHAQIWREADWARIAALVQK